MKILLAVDGSPCSDIAIAEAERISAAAAEIHVVTAIAPLDRSLPRGVTTAMDEMIQQQRTEATRCLEQAVNHLRQARAGLTVVPRLVEGYPKDVILCEAEQWGADLIVLGSHGYGPIRRFFLGSVSLYIALNAHCSVLIARSPSA